MCNWGSTGYPRYRILTSMGYVYRRHEHVFEERRRLYADGPEFEDDSLKSCRWI